MSFRVWVSVRNSNVFVRMLGFFFFSSGRGDTRWGCGSWARNCVKGPGNWVERSGFSKEGRGWGALGIGIDTQVPGSIRKVTRTDIPFHRNFSTNGIGPNILHHNLRFFATFNTLQTNSTWSKTSNFLAKFSQRSTVMILGVGKSGCKMVAGSEVGSSLQESACSLNRHYPEFHA